jgi:hypothetical protein
MRLKTPINDLATSIRRNSECVSKQVDNSMPSNREYHFNYKPATWHDESFAMGVKLTMRSAGFTDTEFMEFVVFKRRHLFTRFRPDWVRTLFSLSPIK